MPLTPGTRLGSYEIFGPLGAGGMGEVYQARDAKLGREVAVKLLPEAFENDPKRLARFEREARLLASLNHPHIATIYGLEEAGGVPFLVLELVPGETLAERLARETPAVEEALAIGRQIAEALEDAHEKGIVHRDLKPANVKVTPAGSVKVLDFGLAKALSAEPSSPELSHSPTITSGDTRSGVVLGTAAYMSPEQARGKPLDKRTDIWSFGCVLYEMLAGRKAFQGESVSDTLAEILRGEPDWTALPVTLPSNAAGLLRRCLQKDPSRRLRDIGDARLELEETLEGPAPAQPDRARREKAEPRPPLMRFSLPLPPEAPIALEKQPALALSPEGDRLVYVAQSGGTTRLLLRALGELDFKPLAGTEGAGGPFFSPDGRWVGFSAGGKLKKVSVLAGLPLILCDAPECRGASWGDGDSIVFAPTPGSGLWKVPAAGGAPQEVTRLDISGGERTHRWPQFLPGGTAVLFMNWAVGPPSMDDAAVAVQSLRTGERRILIEGGTSPRFASTGHLIYAQGGSLLAAPFDPVRLALGGPAFPVLEGVTEEVTGAAHFALSRVGTLAYAPGTVAQLGHGLVWIDRDGAEQPLPAEPRWYEEPHLSPDGKRIALSIGGITHDIWVHDISRGGLTRLTFEGDNYAPVWTPDGKRMVFSSNRRGPTNVFWRAADGSGEDEQLLSSEFEQVVSSSSPDGSLLAFTQFHPKTGADIWLLPLEGDRSPRLFLRTPFNEYGPMFSPDGRFLAYTSDASGRNEVYVTSFPGPGGRWQISTEGGAGPVWQRDGKELFYGSGDQMMAVAVETGAEFAAGAPRMLFERRCGKGLGKGLIDLPNYDVAPDGRLLMIVESEERQTPAELSFVVEWFEELLRRAPPHA